MFESLITLDNAAAADTLLSLAERLALAVTMAFVFLKKLKIMRLRIFSAFKKNLRCNQFGDSTSNAGHLKKI
jgi:hypothetical protein